MSKRGGFQEWVEVWRNEFKSINERSQKKCKQIWKNLKQNLQQKNLTQVLAGGAVYVKVSGNKEVKGITIKKEAVDPDDVEMLQDLILSCVNEALKKGR